MLICVVELLSSCPYARREESKRIFIVCFGETFTLHKRINGEEMDEHPCGCALDVLL